MTRTLFSILLFVSFATPYFAQTLILSDSRKTKSGKDLCLYAHDFRESKFRDSIHGVLQKDGARFKTIIIDYPSGHLNKLDYAQFPNVKKLVLYYYDIDLIAQLSESIFQMKNLKKIICINLFLW